MIFAVLDPSPLTVCINCSFFYIFYIAPFIYNVYLKALKHGSHSFTCKLHYDCFSSIRVHQMAPPLTEVADIQLQLTTHLSTQKEWKAELAWLVDL